MGDWKIVVPEATTNCLDDPSFALADPDTEWAISGDGAAPDWTRSTAYSYWGFSSALADVDSGGGGSYTIIYQQVTTTATTYTLSAYVRRSGGGVPTASHTQAYFNTSSYDWESITNVGNGWYRCVITKSASAGNRQFGVRANEDGLYVDGVQLENKAYATTYCDGTREGCLWDGGTYTSSSTRSAQSRAGGRVRDLSDDYGFAVAEVVGGGAVGRDVTVRPYAALPGGTLSRLRRQARQFTLVGPLTGDSSTTIYARRQSLLKLLAHDAVPATTLGWQPVRLRFEGAAVPKELAAHYTSGLEGSWTLETLLGAVHERVAVSFVATEPIATELGESATVLDTNDTATLRYCAGRLRSTGQWDDLALTSDPGSNGEIKAVCVASDNSVYFGGNFENWNSAGAGGDYVIRFDPSDESWNVLVGASDVSGTVWDIKEGPDGTIYLCGGFESVNGDGTADNIVAYDPGANTWSSLGDPDTTNITTMYEMAFDGDGNLYVVGNFTAVAGVANTGYIAMWDGSSWNAVGTPAVTSGYPVTIAIDKNDNIYIGGTFEEFDGDADANGLAWWDGSDWADLEGAALGGLKIIYSLAYSAELGLFATGNFTNAGGEASADYVFKWNGTSVEALDTGLNNSGYAVKIAPDGMVWVTGEFTTAGDLTCYKKALWNGAAWLHTDGGFTDVINDLAFGPPDAVVSQNYDVYVGTNGSTSTQIAGSATVTNDGSAIQYPVIVVSRSGGSSAYLGNIRNETTGKQLNLDYSLLDGETITIDCRPGKKTVYSSFAVSAGKRGYAVAGLGPGPAFRRAEVIRAASDFGTFALQPGANQLTCLVYVAGAPTITAYVVWQDAYDGFD